MKYIVNFSKQGRMVYISHLDLQRLLLRTLRRIGMKPVYTQGFHPHAKFSLALPLSLGYSSENEYFEFEYDKDLLATHGGDALAVAALNNALPNGIHIKNVKEKPNGVSKTLPALVTGASYEILLRFDHGESSKFKVESFAGEIANWSDSKIASVNVVSAWGNNLLLSMSIHADNGNAPNPVKLLTAFFESLGYLDFLSVISVNRTEIKFRKY